MCFLFKFFIFLLFLFFIAIQSNQIFLRDFFYMNIEETDSETIDLEQLKASEESLEYGSMRRFSGTKILFNYHDPNLNGKKNHGFLLRQNCQIHYDYEFFFDETMQINNPRFYTYKCFSDFKIYNELDECLGTIKHNYSKTEFTLIENKVIIAKIKFKYAKDHGNIFRYAYITYKNETASDENTEMYFSLGKTTAICTDENIIQKHKKNIVILHPLMQSKVFLKFINLDFDVFSIYFDKNISTVRAIFYGIANWEAK